MRNFFILLMVCCFSPQASESKLMQTAYLTSMSISEFTQTQKSLEAICTEKTDIPQAFSNLYPSIETHLNDSVEVMEHFQAVGRKMIGEKISQVFAEHNATINNKVENILQPFLISSHSQIVSACKNWKTAITDSNSATMKRFYEQANFITNNKTAILEAIDNRSNW